MDEQVLWQAYAAECKAHIEEIDDFLQAIETEIDSKGFFDGDVATVFRAFHSLKGTSFGMGVESVAVLAHACEDILGLVRDNGKQIDNTSYGLLYNAIELIRGNSEQAVVQQSDCETPLDVVDKLKADYARINGGEVADTGGGGDAADAGGGEEEDMLAIYCETATDGLTNIFEILSSDDPGERAEELFENIDMLSQGAATLDMEMVADAFTEMQDYLGEPQEALQFFLNNIIGNFEIIYEMAGVELPSFGGIDTRQIQLVALRDQINNGLQEIMVDGKASQDLEHIKMFLTAHLSVPPELSAIMMASEEHAGFVTSMNILSDLVKRMVDDKFDVKTEIVSVFTKTASLLDLIIADTPADDDNYINNADELHNIINFILDPLGDDEDLEDITDVFDIDVIYRSVLNGEQINDIFTRTKAGYNLYGFEVFLDRNKDIGQKILGWLKDDVDMLNNKTIFGNNETGFEFLLLSKLDFESLEKSILALDEKRVLLHALSLYRPYQSAETISLLANQQEAAQQAGTKEHILRVPLPRVEQIMDLVQGVTQHLNAIEEAMSYLNLNQDMQMAQLSDNKANDGYNRYIDALRTGKFNKVVLNEVNLAANRLHNIYETCLDMSLMPIQQLLQRIPRSAKVLAEELGKKVSVMVESDPLNIDNTVYEVLNESLTHLVRNAIDHGIEMPEDRVNAGKTEIGRIKIEIKSLGEELSVVIIDDGNGINHEKVRDKALKTGAITQEQALSMSKDELVRLVLRSSFSTAEQVSQVSGRGVGMDVVNSNIVFLGGSIRIVTEVGKGSEFHLRVPLQSMMQRLVLFEAAGVLFSLPEIFVDKIIHYHEDEIWEHRTFKNINDEYMQIHNLQTLLQLKANDNTPTTQKRNTTNRVAVIARTADHVGAILVDKVIGHREIFLQQSNSFFTKLPYIQRAAVVGTDEVPLVLDVFSILDSGQYKEAN